MFLEHLLLFFSAFCVVSEYRVNAHRRCASCNMRQFDEYRQFRQEQILDDLLAKLELSAKPNITPDYTNLPMLDKVDPRVRQMIDVSVQERVHRFRRSSSRDEDRLYPELYETDSKAISESSFVMSMPPPDWVHNLVDEIAMFNFSKDHMNKIVTHATIHVFLRPPWSVSKNDALSLRVNIYEQYLNGTRGDRIATKHVNLHKPSHPYSVVKLTLDTFDVERWITNYATENAPLGLYIEALHDGENLVVYPNDRNNENMFLEIEMIQKNRNKRAPNVCQPGAQAHKCCLFDLTIDFEKAGWDFVIAPKRYNAYICNGECTAGQMSSTARGSIAQHAKVDFYQCCHPKEYTGITIVYVTNENNIWIKEVPGMIARKCDCA